MKKCKTKVKITLCFIIAYISISAVIPKQQLFTNTCIDFGAKSHNVKSITLWFMYENNTGKTICFNKHIATCGCTKVTYTKKPIKPREKGGVKVEIELNVRKGAIRKSVAIYPQGLNPVVLKIKGVIN